MKRDFHIGPGAASLVLIIVILSMSVMSILTLTNARGDKRLSVRAVGVAEAAAALNVSAEHTLAEIDAALVNARNKSVSEEDYLDAVENILPAKVRIDGNVVSWDESDDEGRILSCMIEIMPVSSSNRFEWKEHRLRNELAYVEVEYTWN